VRVGILGQRGGWHTASLQEALAQRGITAPSFPVTRLTARLSARPWLTGDGGGGARARGARAHGARARFARMEDYDVLFVRIIPGGSLEQVIFRVDALHRLENAGVRVVNSPTAIERTVDKYYTSSLLEDAGLQPVGIDAVPNALFRSFERRLRREEDKQRTIILMDVGHEHTTVVFGRSGGICFVKQIPSGAARFSEEVASTLGLSVPDAESLRLRLLRAEPVDPSTRRSVVDVVTSAAEALAKELSLCLRYHTVTFRGKRVERAVIVGGGAYEPILLDVLRRHLSVEVEVGEPLRGFDSGADASSRGVTGSSADLALAVGLSLKGRRQSGGALGARRAAREPVLEGERL